MVESKLHIAGTIPLDPLTMKNSNADIVNLTLTHLSQIAKEFDMEIEDRDTSILYVTDERYNLDDDNVAKVRVTQLPRKVPIEIEFHLNCAKRVVER
jgi:UPF0288 family protein (methanogenesis marker protein 3)